LPAGSWCVVAKTGAQIKRIVTEIHALSPKAVDRESDKIVPRFRYSKNLPRKGPGKILQISTPIRYGFGEDVVVVVDSVFEPPLGEEPVLIVVFDSVLVVAAGDSFTTVVLFSVLFSPGGLTVVSFCSHAASKAAPARIQIYFLIAYLDV
jgi:hypothetical protein